MISRKSIKLSTHTSEGFINLPAIENDISNSKNLINLAILKMTGAIQE
jgi:hypothetical protein